MPINPKNLFPENSSASEQKQRVKLVNFGAGFDVVKCDFEFTERGLKKFSKLFAGVGVEIGNVRTLQALTDAYGRYSSSLKGAAPGQFVLYGGRGCIPKKSSDRQRLERRVLLSFAPYVHIHKAEITLNQVGVDGVRSMCAQVGIAPSSIRTLEALVGLEDAWAQHIAQAMRAVTPEQLLATMTKSGFSI